MPMTGMRTRTISFFIQGLDFNWSVCRADICYSVPISPIPTTEQLLGEEKTCAKYQIDISKIVRTGPVYIQTDRWSKLIIYTL